MSAVNTVSPTVNIWLSERRSQVAWKCTSRQDCVKIWSLLFNMKLIILTNIYYEDIHTSDLLYARRIHDASYFIISAVNYINIIVSSYMLFQYNQTYRVFRHVVRSSFVFANNNYDWLKQITWFFLANHSCCLQKHMKMELCVERLNINCSTIGTKMRNRFIHTRKKMTMSSSIWIARWSTSSCSSSQ